MWWRCHSQRAATRLSVYFLAFLSGEGGFAHLAALAAVLASPSGSARTTRCTTVQRDCLADARALAGSESPRTLLGATSWCLAGNCTERGGFEPPVPFARHNGFRGLSHRSVGGHPACIDTVLSFGNTANVLDCGRESVQRWGVCHQDGTSLRVYAVLAREPAIAGAAP